MSYFRTVYTGERGGGGGGSVTMHLPPQKRVWETTQRGLGWLLAGGPLLRDIGSIKKIEIAREFWRGVLACLYTMSRDVVDMCYGTGGMAISQQGVLLVSSCWSWHE